MAEKRKLKGRFDYKSIMSIFSRVKGFIMSLFKRYGIEHLNGYYSLLSNEMSNSIDLWLAMAQGRAPWNIDNPPSGVIPSVVGAIADPLSEEIKIESKNERLAEIMQSVDSKAIELVQNLVICGGSIVRPIYSEDKLSYEIIKLGNYIPTSYGIDGTLTGAIIVKKLMDGKKEFLLLEKHEYKNKAHTINNELYEIIGESLQKTTLQACKATAGIDETITWADVEKPFIVEFRNPRANEIDGSAVPVSLFAGHENLIEDADKQYQRINWEQLAGKTKIFIDDDLLPHKVKDDGNGHKFKSKFVNIADEMKDVFVNLDGNGLGESKITPFAPALRTSQQLEAYQQILREIENVTRIGKGTLSNLEEAPQTATAYKGGKAVLYNTVNSIESEFETKYKNLAYIFAYMLSAYDNEAFNPEIEISYDESDRKDAALQRQEDLQEVQNGIMTKAEYRVKHYGETLEEAEANLPQTESASSFGGFGFGE